jgi:alpha-tubulin suppressor-like RCC1 family protein
VHLPLPAEDKIEEEDAMYCQYEQLAREDHRKLKRMKIKTMEAGARHSLVQTVDGYLYSFGFGQHGQLGHRKAKNELKPRQVTDFGKSKKIATVKAGAHHTIIST